MEQTQILPLQTVISRADQLKKDNDIKQLNMLIDHINNWFTQGCTSYIFTLPIESKTIRKTFFTKTVIHHKIYNNTDYLTRNNILYDFTLSKEFDYIPYEFFLSLLEDLKNKGYVIEIHQDDDFKFDFENDFDKTYIKEKRYYISLPNQK